MKTYKTITDLGMTCLYIDHFNTMEAAVAGFNKSVINGAETVYLIEELHRDENGDSENKVLAKSIRKN